MTMPGLPSKPSSENIRLNANGEIEGLSRSCLNRLEERRRKAAFFLDFRPGGMMSPPLAHRLPAPDGAEFPRGMASLVRPSRVLRNAAMQQ